MAEEKRERPRLNPNAWAVLQSHRGTFKITKSAIDRLKTGAESGERTRLFLVDSDLPGFGVYVGMDRHAKKFYAERRVSGKGFSRRVVFARCDCMTPDEARTRAKQLLLMMENGTDPLEERRKEIERERQEREEHERKAAADKQAAVSLRQVWADFKADAEAHCKANTLRQYKNIMESVFAGKTVKGHVYENWMDRPARDITKDDIRRVHRLIGTAHPAYANLAFRTLSSVFGFAVESEMAGIESNPVDILRRKRRGKRAGWFHVGERDNIISDDQLPAWFQAVDSLRYEKDNPIGPVGADYLEFVLLTGMRRGEAAQLKWAQVDEAKRTIRIEETKNRKPLVLPLTPALAVILERRKKAAGDSEFVFPSPGRKGVGTYFTEPRYAIKLVTEKSGIAHSTHDLRRTFSSVGGRLVPYPVLKKMTNHGAKRTGDPTWDHYIRLSVEDLRPHLETIQNFMLAKKAAGQGMKLVKAEGA